MVHFLTTTTLEPIHKVNKAISHYHSITELFRTYYYFLFQMFYEIIIQIKKDKVNNKNIIMRNNIYRKASIKIIFTN